MSEKRTKTVGYRVLKGRIVFTEFGGIEYSVKFDEIQEIEPSAVHVDGKPLANMFTAKGELYVMDAWFEDFDRLVGACMSFWTRQSVQLARTLRQKAVNP